MILTRFLSTLSDHGLRSSNAGPWLFFDLLDCVPPPEVEHGHDLVPEALLVLPVPGAGLVPPLEGEAVVPGDADPQTRHAAPA